MSQQFESQQWTGEWESAYPPIEDVWEVLCDGTVCCSAAMGLTKRQAQGKVDNEKRAGAPLRNYNWTIRRVKHKLAHADQESK